MLARPRYHAPAPAVVDQSVHQLLKHALLVADDDFRRAELQQPLETVVAVDDAAVEVVEVGGGEAAAVQLHHGAQVGGMTGRTVNDHPGRLVAGLAEGLDHAEALGGLLATLPADSLDFVAHLGRQVVKTDLGHDFQHRLGAHARLEYAWEGVRNFTIGLLGEELVKLDQFELVDALLGLLAHVLDLAVGAALDLLALLDGHVGALVAGGTHHVGGVLALAAQVVLEVGQVKLGDTLEARDVVLVDLLACGHDRLVGARQVDVGGGSLAHLLLELALDGASLGADFLLGKLETAVELGLALDSAGLDLFDLVGEALLQLGDALLGALDYFADALFALGLYQLDLALALAFVDFGHDVGGEVEHALQVARRDVEKETQAGGSTFYVPYMRYRRRQGDVAHALAAHAGTCALRRRTYRKLCPYIGPSCICRSSIPSPSGARKCARRIARRAPASRFDS